MCRRCDSQLAGLRPPARAAGSTGTCRKEWPVAPSHPPYTSFVLEVAQRVFCLPPVGEDFGDDLPEGRILLRPLRYLLLQPETSDTSRDAVWAELIRRRRADRSAPLVAAQGMAMPGLRRQGARCPPAPATGRTWSPCGAARRRRRRHGRVHAGTDAPPPIVDAAAAIRAHCSGAPPPAARRRDPQCARRHRFGAGAAGRPFRRAGTRAGAHPGTRAGERAGHELSTRLPPVTPPFPR